MCQHQESKQQQQQYNKVLQSSFVKIKIGSILVLSLFFRPSDGRHIKADYYGYMMITKKQGGWILRGCFLDDAPVRILPFFSQKMMARIITNLVNFMIL